MATLFHALRVKLELLKLLISHRAHMLRLALTLPRIAGGAPDGEGGEGDSGDDDGGDDNDNTDGDAGDDGSSDSSDDDSDDDDGKPAARTEPDWKKMARKHEREAKKARKERDDFERSLKAREDKDKSEQEKAIEQAEQKARQELETKFEKERRNDRLEVAATKLAAKGLKIGTGDKQKTVRFADPDDALLHLERDIREGTLDPEDVFDDNGKVKSDALTDALTDLLERKPHLAADSKPASKVQGSADGGKGAPASSETSVDDHLNKVRRHSSERSTEGAKFRRAA